MKLILKKLRDPDNEHDQTDVTLEADSIIALDDALEVLEVFLTACGFRWVGELTVDDSGYSDENKEG
jgi:hypothetical protein